MTNAEYQKKYRELAKVLKICPICRKRRLFGSEYYCLECNARIKEWHKKKYESMTPEQKKAYIDHNTKIAKRKREQRKAQGICTRCGKNKASDGYFTCEACRRKNRVYRKEKNRMKNMP